MLKSIRNATALILVLGSTLAAAAAQADVFEVVSVPIADGVTEDQMRAADAPVGAFIASLPGFISRENGISVAEGGMANSPGNEWFVLVRWDNLEHAQKAAELLAPRPEAAEMFKHLKADQIFFRHYIVQE